MSLREKFPASKWSKRYSDNSSIPFHRLVRDFGVGHGDLRQVLQGKNIPMKKDVVQRVEKSDLYQFHLFRNLSMQFKTLSRIG